MAGLFVLLGARLLEQLLTVRRFLAWFSSVVSGWVALPFDEVPVASFVEYLFDFELVLFLRFIM